MMSSSRWEWSQTHFETRFVAKDIHQPETYVLPDCAQIPEWSLSNLESITKR